MSTLPPLPLTDLRKLETREIWVALIPIRKSNSSSDELSVSRPTASKYLEQMTAAGLVRKQKLGRTNFYINEPLVALLSGVALDLP